MRTHRLALVGFVIAIPAFAAGRPIHLACHDGVPPPRTLCAAGCTRPYRCDVDAACDGVCTFALRVCGEVACVDHSEAVAVGNKERLTIPAPGGPPAKFVLRCRAHPRGLPCPTSSTTSTTTTTSAPTTSTTAPSTPPSCQQDADCVVPANPCVFPLCFQPGICACACLADGHVTCSPAQADTCQSNADCPPVVGDPCRHCEQGLCMTNPLCV